LRENPNKMLSTILVGNTLVNISAASLATSVFISLLERRAITSESIAVALATITTTVLILVFGEITPKTIAMKSSERIALFVAPIIAFTAFLFSPVIYFLNLFCKPLIKLFGGDTRAHVPFVTEEELKMLLSVGQEEGVIEQEEKEMIHSIFEFSDTTAKAVMTPRPDMFCLDASLAINEAIKRVIDEGHSRVPVYEGTVDNITGVIFAKDLLALFAEGKQEDLKNALRPPLFVPESKKLDDLLRQMQSSHMHIAIIVDEYGGTAGIVTLEDLLEEIVGEIKDEFDIEEKSVDVADDGSALVDAGLSVNEVNEKIGTSLPEGDYDTIGGFVVSLLGKLPTVGDITRFEDLRIYVEKVFKKRITRIKIVKISGASGEGANIVGG
ncbi:MAG: hemolysin family protein, partial [Candidatus Margulisiibacteriota bacterium]